ncbi:MAG: drug/metabolite exporter YedA [Candidatus Eremiobacterota bacterium]
MRTPILLALLAVYFIWGSTYLAIRLTLESLPPMLTAGFRFTLSGAVMLGFLRVLGHPWPAAAQWRSAFLIGSLLMVGGNGLVMQGERWVHSGLAAVMIASVGLWAALFSGLFGRWPTGRESAGIALGLAGVALLQLEGNLRAHPLGALLLLISAIAWALGSVWSQHLDMPRGLMSGATQMFCGGLALVAVGVALGESWPAHASARSLWAFAYLLVFGSLLGFTAYSYLLQTVSPALATSYAYVNPVVAVLLGVAFAGEAINPAGLAALCIVVGAVALVATGRRPSPPHDRDCDLAEVA